MDDFNGGVPSLHFHRYLRPGIRGLSVFKSWFRKLQRVPNISCKSPLRPSCMAWENGVIFQRRGYADGRAGGKLTGGQQVFYMRGSDVLASGARLRQWCYGRFLGWKAYQAMQAVRLTSLIVVSNSWLWRASRILSRRDPKGKYFSGGPRSM